VVALKQGLEQFFNDVIDEDIAVDHMVDHDQLTAAWGAAAGGVGVGVDLRRSQHFVRLLEMVLLCSIKCENKHETIGRMTSLAMDSQRTLMTILQALMTRSGFVVKSDVAAQPQPPPPSPSPSQDAPKQREAPSAAMATPTAFRRLSMAKYSAERRPTAPLLSPFGSKRKSSRFSIDSAHSIRHSQRRSQRQPLRFSTVSSTVLKKENLTLSERNETLSAELEALKSEHKETAMQCLALRDEAAATEQRVRRELAAASSAKEKALNFALESAREDVKRMEEEMAFKNEEVAAYKEHLSQLQEENERQSQQLQDIEEAHDRRLRAVRDELDIAQHQSNSAYAMEKQMKQYQQRLEAMNDLEADLAAQRDLHRRQSAECDALRERLKAVPALKQQAEKYKAQMIEFKVAAIGAAAPSDRQAAARLARCEEQAASLKLENDTLSLRLTASRKEVISLQSLLSERSSALALAANQKAADLTAHGAAGDAQRTISRLESENERLRAAAAAKHSMADLVDELDTKSRMLSATESKYEQSRRELAAVAEELSNLRTTSAEWMRSSCSPQQFQSTVEQLERAQSTLRQQTERSDALKAQIDALREHKLGASSTIKELEAELNRIKQRYRDLFEYTERQKQRLGDYKKALSELQSAESTETNHHLEARKYCAENQALRDRLRCLEQEMECVQNAAMALLKRLLLANHHLLSKQAMAGNQSADRRAADGAAHGHRGGGSGGGGGGGGGDGANQPPSELATFDKLRKRKLPQTASARQNAFISSAARGRGRGRGDPPGRKIRRPSSFSFRK